MKIGERLFALVRRGRKAHRERRPRHETDSYKFRQKWRREKVKSMCKCSVYTELVVDFWQRDLDLVPAQEMVLGLFANGQRTVELATVVVRLGDLDRRPARRAPVHCPAVIDHVTHCPHHFCAIGSPCTTHIQNKRGRKRWIDVRCCLRRAGERNLPGVQHRQCGEEKFLIGPSIGHMGSARWMSTTSM